jgi:hypothetical protein
MNTETFLRWSRPWFTGLALVSPWAVPFNSLSDLVEAAGGRSAYAPSRHATLPRHLERQTP